METNASADSHGSPKTSRRITIELAACAILVFGGISIPLMVGYPAFVTRPTSALAEANASARAAAIDYALFVKDVLEPIGSKPLPESQARELVPLKDNPEEMRESGVVRAGAGVVRAARGRGRCVRSCVT